MPFLPPNQQRQSTEGTDKLMCKFTWICKDDEHKIQDCKALTSTDVDGDYDDDDEEEEDDVMETDSHVTHVNET